MRVTDHDGVDRAGFHILPAQFAAHVCFRVNAVFLIDVIGGVERLQPFDLLLQIIGQRIIGSAHMLEMCIAAFGRKRAGHQNRTHRRDLVVRMVGVPCAADVGFLIRLLADDRDFRVFLFQREILVDVDLTPALGKGDVFFGGKLLLAKHRHAVFVDQLLDLIHRFALYLRKLDSGDFYAAIGRHRCGFHGPLLWRSAAALREVYAEDDKSP